MPKRSLLAAVVAAVAAALALVAVRPALSAEAAAPVRIMPLGDSITGSPGCWRATLWSRLQSAGYTDVDFVGTLPAQGCGFTYDGENEGHGGILATNMANENQLPAWLSATNPDVVMMHLGTNDVWSARTPQAILAAFTTLVTQMRANNPTMRILVAKIIPVNPSSCAECAGRTVAFNDAIPAWASATSTAQSPVIVVDQWTGFNTATDTYDGVHPNAAGDQKMSDTWFPALTSVLDGVLPSAGPTTPGPAPTTPVPTTPVTTTPPPGNAGCSATYQVIGQWQDAFQGEVAVRNSGDSRTSGWTVTWTFANGQQIDQSWSGAVSQSGSTVTARNAEWNGGLDVGASTSFGFTARLTGSANAAPTLACTAS